MGVEEITSSRKWFHANITRDDTETLLLNLGKDGSFLVRPSTNHPGDYVLSVREGREVTHVRIQSTGECYDLYGGEQFATLTELVQHYMEDCSKLKQKNGEVIELQHPLLSANPTTEKWFYPKVPGKTAEVMLMEKGENGSYLVRESLRLLGNFVLSVRVNDKVMHVIITYNDGKYWVEGCDNFDSLADLIEYNKEYPLKLTDGTVIKLEVPLVRQTHISVLGFSKQVQSMVTEEQENNKNVFTVEFETLQHEEFKDTPKKTEGKKPENKPKNRYRNILPFDISRVVLKEGDPNIPGSDYINANIIVNRELPEDKRQYIATQGCLETTIMDFWRMIWQENTRVIVMTAKLIEQGKCKCLKYWPDINETHDYMTYTGLIMVNNLSEKEATDYVMREFEMSFKSSDKDVAQEPSRKIYHFHFKSWPDHGVPSEPGCVLSYIQSFGDRQDSIPDAGPIVVHCSAGIGRTGTVIIIDMILQQIKQKGLDCEIDVTKMTLMVRGQRSGMVQTEAQYKFIYMAMKHYIDTTLQRTQENKKCVYENIGPLKTDCN